MRKLLIVCCMLATPSIASASVCEKVYKTEGIDAWVKCRNTVSKLLYAHDPAWRQYIDPPEYEVPPDTRSLAEIRAGITADSAQRELSRAKARVEYLDNNLRTPCASYGACRPSQRPEIKW